MTYSSREKSESFPLSLSQCNIWDLERSFSGTSINCISTTIRIKGRVDFMLLQKAINLVVRSDSSLRARLIMQHDVPLQFHAPYDEEVFPVFDFSLTDEEGISHWEAAITGEAMPLYEAPLYRFILFRIDERSAGVLVKTHHIISDGWTQVALCNRIGQTYLDLLAGNEPELEVLPSYSLYIDAEREYLKSRSFEKDREYWQDVISGAGDPAAVKTTRSATVSPVGRRLNCRLPQSINHAIYSFCCEKRVAPFSVFYMALAIYLKRIGGSSRSIIGVPIFNRTNYSFKKTTGMFVSTMPFVNELSEDWSFNEFNENLEQNWLEMLRHQRFPFTHISEISGKSGPLFHVALSYQDSKILESRDACVAFSGRWHYGGYQAEHLCIHLTNLEDNRKYTVDYDYLTQIFTDREIEELHTYLCHILTAALKKPDCPIRSLAILNQEEQERVLYTFNQTKRTLHAAGLYETFAKVVEEHPCRVALIYQGKRTTYTELGEEAKRVAAAIAESGSLIAVILPRTPQLFASIIGIMQAGCAWMILPPELPPRRINEILCQSGATAIISTLDIADSLGCFDLPLIDANNLPEPTNEYVATELSDLAYVVYTSGSTGKPKGVEITQRNLQNFISGARPLYAKGAVLSLCNIGFDAFILESAAAILNAHTIVLPEDDDQENPVALAGLITGFAVGFMAITPSRLAAYLKYPAFQSAMRGMESIVCGGEAFPRELIGKLSLCSDARVYNQYGPSETTVGVSYKLLTDAERITAGKPMENCRLYVLDQMLQPLPIGILGDLYIGGSSVGRGYRNAPELTKESFIPSPFETGDTLYKTGDMACWTPGGEIVLAGRRDRQVKLRGLRIEPQEVSNCLASHPDVQNAAARIWEQNGQNLLVAYYSSKSPVPEAELLSFTGAYLPRYMIPARIIYLESIPLSSNGKVDEDRLPRPDMEECVLQAGSALQAQIVSIFRRVLQKDDLHAGSDYFLWGGNSLNAMETIGRIEEATGARLRISDLYACRTAKRLDEYISGNKAVGGTYKPILPAPEMDRYPLSPTQKNIYVQSFIDPFKLAYNMPGAFRLKGRPDMGRLQQALYFLVMQDDVFRTSFVQTGGDVFGYVSDTASVDIEEITASSLEEAFWGFLRPFDLAKAPLLRAAVWLESNESYILLIDSHHIISDGVSTPIILGRLSELYQGIANAIPLTYKDYACYLENPDNMETDKEKEYWQKQLTPLPENLDLPLDMPRPAAFDYRGGMQSFAISREMSIQADAFCERNGLTAYMLFAGVFGLLLSKISGQSDLVIGSPVSNRDRPELQNVCGPFMGTLPLRLLPEGDINEYFNRIKDTVLDMLDHRELPLSDILAMFNIPRSLSKNPIYQVMFSMRPLDAGNFTLGDEPMEYIPIHSGTAKLDLSLEASRQNDSYIFHFEYAASLFLPETIAIYGRSFEVILGQLLKGSAKDADEISAVSLTDKSNYIDRPSRTFTPYLDMPIQSVFEETAMLYPDETAVIWHDEKTSFRELNNYANSIAGTLIKNGALPGDRVGFAYRRTPEMLACMFGILKAGCAYVPVLADYPAQRIAYMIENSGAKLLICDEETAALLPEDLPCQIVAIDGRAQAIVESVPRCGSDPIYVLYTSGSTGQPKGVMLPHKAISNLLESIKNHLGGQKGPVLCSTNVTFDIFITESLLALAQGLTVVLADEEEMLLPWKLASLMEKHHTAITQFTPSRLQLCLNNSAFAEAAKEIKFIILVGENVMPSLVNQFKAKSAGRFMNMYGPTEAAVYVTAGELFPGEPVTIGKPLNNCRIYVLDEKLRHVMPTARGELYLAGECLADGYISRPDLTEKVFLPDPFIRGQRMYRSGDIGRLRSDGTFECLGRCDSQIKVNGNRVELDEITGAMIKGGADQAVTVHLGNPDGSVSLYGFVTPATADVARMKDQMSRLLPSYMMPSMIWPLEKLPYNPSGKTNIPILKEWARNPSKIIGSPDEPVRRDENPPPPFAAAGVKEPDVKNDALREKTQVTAQDQPAQIDVAPEALLEIWKEALGRSDLKPDASFFEQGGTSLGALTVLSQYFNRGLNMTMAQFYENPTALAQAALLGGGKTGRLQAEARTDEKSEDAPPAPSFASQVPQFENRNTRRAQTVLITGATGFLGAHLIYALLSEDINKVICLLRDGSRERLMERLAWYFGSGWVNNRGNCIDTVRGDISLPRFGLDSEAYDDLALRVDAVYHAAADVRHYTSGSDSVDTNLRGTEEVIEFALHSGARLMHMSTASVSGDYVRSAPGQKTVFKETDFYIGQNWEDNIYIKTKFLAENAVFKAMAKGLDAKVFRLGRLSGRATDGVFQCNPESNAVYNLVQGITVIKAIPSSLAAFPVELTPVDVCAEVVLKLADAPLTAYHIINPKPVALAKLVCETFPDVRVTSDEEFRNILSARSAAEDRDILPPLIEMSNRLDSTNMTISVSCEETQKHLESLGYHWPNIPARWLLQTFVPAQKDRKAGEISGI